MVILSSLDLSLLRKKLLTKSMSNKFYRKKVNYNQDQITFQATEWVDLNENFEIETDDEPIIDQRYVLKVFGVTEQGVSVCCNVKEFTPFFYVKIPNNWGKTNVSKFIDNLFLTKTYRYSRPYPDLLKYRKNILEDRCIIQIKKDFYGFNNQADFKFLRLTFNNSDVMRRVLYKIRHHNDPENESVIKDAPKELKIYEANLDPILRFIHIKNLQPAGWITAKKIIPPTMFTSKCQIEFDVIYTNIEPFDRIENAPILQASFDIETYSHDDAFPSPKHPDNHVFQIATTFKRYTEDDTFFKHIICLKKCAPLGTSDIHLECYDTEREVLLAWVNLIQKMDPDIIYSYNGDQFDCNYLVERAKLLGIENQFYNISRLKDTSSPPCKLVVKTFSSSAYGDSEYNRLLIPGRINFDILIYIRREYKETSYKLDYIAEKYVGENKNPVTPQMMFDAFRYQDAEKVRDVAYYCFPTGTRVSLRNHTVDISMLEYNINNDVSSYYEENNGFGFSKQLNFFKNGLQECIKITLEDSSTINCTKDHQVLTKDGWKIANNLTNNDKILCYPEQAYIDYKSEKNNSFTFSESLKDIEYEKACIISRLLGYIITDGCLANDKCYKNYSTRKLYVYPKGILYIQTLYDVKNVINDIKILTGKDVVYKKTQRTYNICLPVSLVKQFLSITGIDIGKKLKSNNFLPDFIKNDETPLYIKREFLKGLFGGDGGCPSVNKKSNKHGNVCLVQSKIKEYIPFLKEDMKCIKNILQELDIQSVIHNEHKNKHGEGYTINLNISVYDTIKFYEKIGYAYCIGKTYKLCVISSYLKLKNTVYNQYKTNCEEVLHNSEKNKISYNKSIEIFKKNIIKDDIIYNEYWYTPTESRIASCKKNSKKTKRINLGYNFITIEDYLKNIEAFQWFIEKNGKHSYAIKKDTEYVPPYYLRVKDIKNIGNHEVFDIEVENTHNFIANGLTVHNCVQDTLLPQKISDALHILQNQISMSNVTYVPIKYLIERGQQIKAFSQILRETRKLGYLVPTLYNNSDGETDDQTKFQGATVLPPITGAYFEPVTVCDFASLYPSIIRAHNLCYSTIVTDPKYNNLPGVEYETFTWEDKNEKTDTVVKHSFDFVKNVPGILPGILKELAESRNYYKKLMKGAKNTFEKEIYNKSQLAVKVSMNSVYGFLAAQMLTCKPIAATVTYVGRTMIANTKKFMEDNYQASVAVYGDSVTYDTPIITKENITGFIDIRQISDFSFDDEWKPYEEFKPYSTNRTDKQQYKPINYSIWSDNGWVPLHRIIRHRCDKNIFRVTTNSGSVDVTEDHSLLTPDIVKVKPKDLIIGDKLLHINNFPSIDFIFSNTIFANTEHVKLLGFLFKNANISKRTISNGVILNSLSVTHRSRECLKMILELIYKYEKVPSQPTEIYRMDENNGYMFEIINNPDTGYTIVEKINECFYNTSAIKRVPGLLINSPEYIRKSFIEGVLMFNNFTFAYDTEDKITTQGLLILAESVGITLKTNDIGVYMSFDDKEQTCRTELLSSSSIIDIKNLGKTDNYVYDIETGIGRFHASVGKIVVANTDSVFIKFKTETTEKYTREKDRIYSQVVITDTDKAYINELKTKCIRESIVLGKEAAQKATKALFKEPINLEYEKVYTPLLMLSKKRYIGQLYSENPEKYDKIDNKGVILTRRDNFNLLKIAYKTIVDIYMEKGSIGNNEVIKYIENIMDSIKNKNVNLDDLIITKSLRKDYKSQNIPHLVLSRKLAERDPNNAPRANDRIPYLFIDTNVAKIMPQYTKVEDPEYVRTNNLALDAEYYIKFIANPLCEIMELFIDNPEKIFKDYIKKFKDARKLRLKPPKPVTVKKVTKPRVSKKKI